MAVLSRERLAILRAARLPPRRNRRAPRGCVIIQLNASAARHLERRSKAFGGRVVCSSVVWASFERQNALRWFPKESVNWEGIASRASHQLLATRGKPRASKPAVFHKITAALI